MKIKAIILNILLVLTVLPAITLAQVKIVEAPILILEEKKEKVLKEIEIYITGYSSTPDQTDDTPFITANGKEVYDGVVAANFLPFGTKIKIPELYGDKIFIVEDRMHKRYKDRIDIWFPDRESAQNFGIQFTKVQILEG